MLNKHINTVSSDFFLKNHSRQSIIIFLFQSFLGLLFFSLYSNLREAVVSVGGGNGYLWGWCHVEYHVETHKPGVGRIWQRHGSGEFAWGQSYNSQQSLSVVKDSGGWRAACHQDDDLSISAWQIWLPIFCGFWLVCLFSVFLFVYFENWSKGER